MGLGFGLGFGLGLGLGFGLVGWAHQVLVGRPGAQLAEEYGGEAEQADDLDVAQDRRAH